MSTDPFDTPPHDPVTGEVLDGLGGGEQASTYDPFAAPPPTFDTPATDLLPFTLGRELADAIPHARSRVLEFAGDMGSRLAEHLHEQYQALVDARPVGIVTASTVQPELVWLADTHEVLAAFGKVLTEAAGNARALAGEVVQEVRTDVDLEHKGGSASVKVGTTAAAAVKVTATQPTETFTDTDAVVDVLVAHLIGRYAAAGDAMVGHYAVGAREMAAHLLGLHGVIGLLTKPGWKSTALDLLRTTLESAGEQALATRLGAAYGRRPVGNVQTKIERTELVEQRRV